MSKVLGSSDKEMFTKNYKKTFNTLQAIKNKFEKCHSQEEGNMATKCNAVSWKREVGEPD